MNEAGVLLLARLSRCGRNQKAKKKSVFYLRLTTGCLKLDMTL
jgi:hypothetical protein